MFAAFVQMDPPATREVGGLGTGLAMVRHLRRLMGAEVSAHSSAGEGTVFTMKLRVAA